MKIRRYTYIIVDGGNYRATYNQDTATKAQADGKTVLAVCGEFADVQDLAYDAARHNQIEVNLYNVDDREKYAKQYGMEHAPELYKEWLTNKVKESIHEAKKYNDMMESAFNDRFVYDEHDGEYDEDEGWY